LITKVLVNRLRPFLDDLIGPLQSSFIPGRNTSDNALTAQEVLHFMHKTIGKQGYLAAKVDLEKAYDRVNWEFFYNTLEHFGFLEGTIKLIMFCVQSTSLTLLWNGSKLPYFSPNQGLRQGDPLSQYLFVLNMEKLSCLISKKVSDKVWQPIHVSKNGLGISHLLFADDVLLFIKANKTQICSLIDVLTSFCNALGLIVNFDKSRVMTLRNVSRHLKNTLAQL
jgi:hypothetical protein